MKSIFACVKCGKPASEGSAQHPFCERDFKKVWGSDYKAYVEWLKEHPSLKGRLT